MREMKDSGVEWIGEIPSDWDIVKTKRFFRNEKRVVRESVDDYERLALTMNGVLKRSKDDSDGLQPEKFEGYQILKQHELVFKLIDLENVKTSRVGLSPYTGIVSPAYIVLTNQNDDNRFFYYWFISMYYNEIFNQLGGAGVRSALNAKEVLNLPIVSMPETTQHRIADYLDRKCSKIDEIIEKEGQVIEKLKAYKLSVITEAVTKGLNPNVPMKDSGVEWIGEIPEDWRITKITRLLDYNHPYPIGDGDHGIIKTQDYQETGIPYIRVQNLGWGTPLKLERVVYISEEKNKSIKNSTLCPGDILFAKTGGTIGKTAIVPYTIPKSNTTSHIGKITVQEKYNQRFVFYLLSSFVGYKQFWDIAGLKSTRPELTIDEIRKIKIIVPSTFSEQQIIADYLDQKCTQIDVTITKKQSTIEKLTAYKKSLIYEVVTGKKEV